MMILALKRLQLQGASDPHPGALPPGPLPGALPPGPQGSFALPNDLPWHRPCPRPKWFFKLWRVAYSLYANAHSKHEYPYSVLNSIWPKSELS